MSSTSLEGHQEGEKEDYRNWTEIVDRIVI